MPVRFLSANFTLPIAGTKSLFGFLFLSKAAFLLPFFYINQRLASCLLRLYTVLYYAFYHFIALKSCLQLGGSKSLTRQTGHFQLAASK